MILTELAPSAGEFFSDQLFEELPLRIPHGLHVGLCVEFHGRPEVLVAQQTLHGLRVHFQLDQSGRKRVPKVVKTKV